MRFHLKPIFLFSLVIFAFGCTSEYHWVKMKSKDPILISKMDENAKKEGVENVENKDNPSLKSEITLEPPKAHGLASITPWSIIKKAHEIENTLSENRKMDLLSHNRNIKEGAIQVTLHEQLLKDSYFSKLSISKQLKLENKLSHRVYKTALPRRGSGVNSLLVLGLILLLLSLLFVSSGSIYAVIGILFSVILIILGLVQGIGF